MFLLILSLLSVVVTGAPVHNHIQGLGSRSQLLTFAKTSRRQIDACQSGARNVVVDSKTMGQTMTWDIGEVNSRGGEKFCKTTMPMNYNSKWQYAVTSIDWTSHIQTDVNTQAVVQLVFGSENNPTAVGLHAS